MAIHRDRSVADLKGRRAYFNHCFTASSSPPSRLAYPFLSLHYPSTLSLHILLLYLYYLCTMSLRILLLYLYYLCTMSLQIILPYLYYPRAYPWLCPGAYFQLDYAAPRAYPSQICTNLFALSSLPHANLHVIRMLCRF